jgi:hypothetical protein
MGDGTADFLRAGERKLALLLFFNRIPERAGVT